MYFNFIRLDKPCLNLKSRTRRSEASGSHRLVERGNSDLKELRQALEHPG